MAVILFMFVLLGLGLTLAAIGKARTEIMGRNARLTRIQQELARRDAEWEAEQARHHSQDTDT